MNQKIKTQAVNLLSLICPVALTVFLVASAYAQNALIY